MRKILFIFGIVVTVNATAQATSLDSLEALMASFQKEMTQGATDAIRTAASDSLRTTLISTFAVDGSFEYPFYKLIRVASITSPDQAFRLFNWNVAHLDGTYSFYGFVVFPNGQYVELQDTGSLTQSLEKSVLKPDEWYGALYYEIYPVSEKRETYYTLMGWDGNDKLSNKKVLDVLNIDKKKRVTFGKPIYQVGEQYLNRVIFEYAEKARINLRYLSPKEAIIYERLEPEEAGLKGHYEFYIPSTAYNAYVLNNKGLWELHEFFDMTRPKSEETGAQFNFPDRFQFDRRR